MVRSGSAGFGHHALELVPGGYDLDHFAFKVPDDKEQRVLRLDATLSPALIPGPLKYLDRPRRRSGKSFIAGI